MQVVHARIVGNTSIGRFRIPKYPYGVSEIDEAAEIDTASNQSFPDAPISDPSKPGAPLEYETKIASVEKDNSFQRIQNKAEDDILGPASTLPRGRA